MQTHFQLKGYDVSPKAPRASSSGNAQIIELKNHGSLKEVQYHTGGGVHEGSYYKFTNKDNSTINVINPDTYIPRTIKANSTFFNQAGQKLVFQNGSWVRVN